MTEAQAWSSLRESMTKEATAIGRAIHICRIENMVGIGTFDTNIAIAGKEFWLEGKHMVFLPVRRSTLVRVGMREEQHAFATRRLGCGSPSWLWCKVSHDRAGVTVGTAGWYLFELNSQDIIDKLRHGMEQQEFLLYKHVSSRLMARHLLNCLFPELSHVEL